MQAPVAKLALMLPAVKRAVMVLQVSLVDMVEIHWAVQVSLAKTQRLEIKGKLDKMARLPPRV
jgi:hypothetical protein